MKTIYSLNAYFISGILLVAALLLSSLFIPNIAAAQQEKPSEFKNELCGGANLSLSTGDCSPPGENPTNKLNDLVAVIINVLSIVIGIVAVIMILWGGLKFITSGGDSGQVASARQTILYAIVGLLIVAFAQVFVRFVLNRVA